MISAISMDQQLADLLACREIEQNIIRFARAMDERDWEVNRSIMADTVVAEMGEGRLEGPQAVIDLMRRYLDRCGVTQHLIGNIVVTVTGDTASSRAYVRDSHLPADGAHEPFYTLGDYHDRWEKQDGTWRMVERIKDNRAHIGSIERVFAF